jgi:hypothetical protein
MVQDRVISEQAKRIVVTQICIAMWVPEFTLPGRFLQARARARHAVASLGHQGKRGADVQAARDAYRHAADNLDFLLWMFIMNASEELRPILDDLEAYPDLRGQSLIMRGKFKGLEDDLRSRDSSIAQIALRYGELKGLLENVFQIAKQMFGPGTVVCV